MISYQDDAITILQGNALDELRGLPDESIHCCVTSPPYWGLRDYGVAGQIGMEKTPEEYVERLVAVFREVKRVLRPDGTLWLNIGDSYAGSWGAQGRQGKNGQMAGRSVVSARQIEAHPKRLSNTGSIRESGLKPKDLIGIPWRVAFALRADGWYLRSDIIWAKPNGMPESVTDRPTRSHEYLFLLSKSERYHFNAEAVRTPPRTGTILRLQQPSLERQQGSLRANGESRTDRPMKAKIPKRDKQRGHLRQHEGFNQRWDYMTHEEQQMNGANIRDVWWISPMPFKEAHFATFPPELIQPCILAGCMLGGVVLDPFLGSGTTAMVAEALNCKSIGIELNPNYIKIALRRLKQKGLFLG